MLDFHHTWPYERVKNDLYFEECPFCHTSPVLIPIKKEAVQGAFEGIKAPVVMPCCHERIVIESMDRDYIWADRKLR
ncbi:hypothetical protein EWI07_00335 [Sporolactobacillus sp. THM7-4]|nr:hypothetical protein EWI07_00335 [Sporolactobacillus sp. THM7-4]